MSKSGDKRPPKRAKRKRALSLELIPFDPSGKPSTRLAATATQKAAAQVARAIAQVRGRPMSVSGALLAGEVRRMTNIYGSEIAERENFLNEYGANLGLFRDPTPAAFERADLLARAVLPLSVAAGFDAYAPANVATVRPYVDSLLREVEAEFERTQNPVFAWQGVQLAARYSIDWPSWLQAYLGQAADQIIDLSEQFADDKLTKKDTEAECVGKALGFGAAGRGKPGQFKLASMLELDRLAYFEVEKRLAKGEKLYLAREAVGKQFKTSPSAIARSCERMKALTLA